MPAIVPSHSGDLDGAAVLYGAKPRPQRQQQRAREAVFIGAIHLHQAAKRRAGDDSQVARKRALIFLVGHERIDFASADQCDMPGFGGSQVFLEKDAFSVIQPFEP